MNKLPIKKLIITFDHNQEKLYFWQTKIIEMYDVGTVQMKSVVANSKEEAVERLKMYFNSIYEISPTNIIVHYEPKPRKPQTNKE